MLSTETPSCSNSKDSSALNLHSDERASSDLAHGLHHPSFSIRDYVSKSRSKDTGLSNWPFSDQFLKLCLNNGIRDVLPPFEPPSLVRAHCFRRRQVYSEQLPRCSENKTASFEQHEEDIELDSSAIKCLDQSQLSLPVNKLIQSASHENNVSSLTSHDDLIGGSSGEQLKRKCRLPEDLVSNSVIVSDPMASKVCPVCKSFSSSSNTTLNAHIDQCLSSDQSNATRDVGEFSKHRVMKPMKKRLMVDIYTTALHCTLEDLDRRNGTNWATTTTNLPPVPPPANDISLEPKRTKFVPSASDGNVGDIYVDSNGTKLLILSKVNDSPSMVSMKNFKMKKQGKGFEEGRKKKCFEPTSSKLINDTPHKKKLGVLDEIEETEGDDFDESDEENEDEFLPNLSNSCDQVKNNEPSALGHWVCSKRSDLSRKNSNNDIYKSDLPRKIGNMDVNKGSVENIVGSRKLMVKHNQPDSGPSFVKRSLALNSPSSSKAVTSPKTKGLNMLSRTTTDMDSRKKRSHHASNLGSKSLFRDNSLNDSHMAETSSTYTYESHCSSLIDGKGLTSKKSSFPVSACISLETTIVGKGEKFITPRKFHCRKLRGFHGTSEESNKPSNNCQSNFSENQEDKSLGTTDPIRSSLTVAPISETNLDPIPEEHAESISGNDTQEESTPQRSMSNHEVQSEDAINNELISHDTQIEDNQTEAAVCQEPSPCFASNAVLGLENTQENSSTTSVTVKSKKDRSMAIEMEPSGSPVSTTSEFSPLSPIGTKTKDSLADQPPELTQVHEKLSSKEVRKDTNVKLSPPVRGASCSCSESLSRESQLSIQGIENMASNLFITPSTLSSFQAYPTSTLTVDTSKPSDPCSCSSRTQSPSNPILRLMGKDLVVNKEESMHLPSILPCNLDYSPRPSLISFGHPNNIGFVSYSGRYHYQMQPPSNYQIPLQPPQLQPRSVIPSYPLQEVSDDSHDVELATLRQTVQNTNPMTPQMPQFPCFPSQNPYASRAAVNPGQRQNLEGPFLFPSPSSLYFYQTMR